MHTHQWHEAFQFVAICDLDLNLCRYVIQYRTRQDSCYQRERERTCNKCPGQIQTRDLLQFHGMRFAIPWMQLRHVPAPETKDIYGAWRMSTTDFGHPKLTFHVVPLSG